MMKGQVYMTKDLSPCHAGGFRFVSLLRFCGGRWYNAPRGRFAPGRHAEKGGLPMEPSTVDAICNVLLVVIGIIGLLMKAREG